MIAFFAGLHPASPKPLSHPGIVMFLGFLQLLLASAAALLPRKDPDITVEFCGERDHLVICIDGTQTDLINQKPRGIITLFELWASEEEILTHLDYSNRARESTRSPNLIASLALGQKALNLMVRMRHDPAFAKRVKDQVITKLRAFRADPVVDMQTRYYRERRMADRKIGSVALLVFARLVSE